MILAHRIELDPTVKQREYFARAAGCARFVWNWLGLRYNRTMTNQADIRESGAEKSRRLSRVWKRQGRCAHCGGDRDDERYVICSKCRARTRRLRDDLMTRRKEAGICQRCGKTKVDGFLTCEACNKRVYKYPSATGEYRRERYRKVKDEAFMAYGGYVCACCGESEPLFLCLDHINNDGADQRAEGTFRGRGIYQWLKNNGYPSGFRVLCQNCNVGRYLNGGTCPHRDENAAVNLKQNRAGSARIDACGDCGADGQTDGRETAVEEAGTTTASGYIRTVDSSYDGVSPMEYTRLTAAPSIGKHFIQNIRGVKTSQRIS